MGVSERLDVCQGRGVWERYMKVGWAWKGGGGAWERDMEGGWRKEASVCESARVWHHVLGLSQVHQPQFIGQRLEQRNMPSTGKPGGRPSKTWLPGN
eukprot:165789-Chlamydomonas_euryale.AAC.2